VRRMQDKRSGVRGRAGCVCFEVEGEEEGEAHAGAGKVEEDGDREEEVDVGDPRSSPRQLRPSAGFATTTTYAGAQSAGRGVQSVVSAGAAARAVVRVESAGSPERECECRGVLRAHSTSVTYL
jgi:hypothetical protein